MISSFVRALISALKTRRELVPADELNGRHTGSEHTVLLLQVVDHILLLAVDPAS